MKVSVLISVLNGEGFINQALSSIQNQTYKVDQVVVINDASSDNTSLLLDSWKKKLPIFLITNKTNLGLVDSLNIGLSYCNGDWIFRLDHDDWWAINHVERLLHLISNSPNASFVSSRAVFLNPNSANYQLSSILNSCKIYSSLMWDNPIVQSSTAIQREALISVGGYKRVRWEDYDLWIRLLSVGNFYFLNEITTSYLVRFDSISRVNKKLSLNARWDCQQAAIRAFFWRRPFHASYYYLIGVVRNLWLKK
jgi:glycosyltransferase involved in cell wall biosynthesis